MSEVYEWYDSRIAIFRNMVDTAERNLEIPQNGQPRVCSRDNV